jgi:hypothetical protein
MAGGVADSTTVPGKEGWTVVRGMGGSTRLFFTKRHRLLDERIKIGF